jgi:hypothetical protein
VRVSTPPIAWVMMPRFIIWFEFQVCATQRVSRQQYARPAGAAVLLV